MNMQAMMREAQKLQKELTKAQEELEKTEYIGSSSLVKVKINGNKELTSISIDSDNSLEKEDIEMLEDMILVAHNDAANQVDKVTEEKMGAFTKGMPKIPGLF